MIKNVMDKTVEVVRERERESIILTKLCSVKCANKSNINGEIGYVNRCKSYK